MQASRLRPLSIGEMLDRAVSLSVKYFVPLSLIWLAFSVPLLILQYYGTADYSRLFSEVLDSIQRGVPPKSGASAAELAALPVFNGFTVAYTAYLLFVSPLAHAALIVALSSAYLYGTAPSVSEAYRTAVRSWLNLIGAALIWLAFALLAYVALVGVGIVVGLLLFGVTALSKDLGVVTIVLAIIVGIAAIAVCAAVAAMAVGITFYSVIVEGSGFITAFSTALARTVGRTLQRSLFAGLAYGAVILGLSLVQMLVFALVAGAFHFNHVALAAASVVPTVIVSVFTSAFICTYYFDVRVRTEGFDLDIAARENAVAVPAAE